MTNPDPMRRLRVLMVPHLTEVSGAPMMASRIAAALDSRRFDCLTVFPGPGGLADRMKADGMPVETLDLMPIPFRQALREGQALSWFASRRAYLCAFHRLLRRFRPDVVYIHSTVQILPGLAAWWRGIPIVWHVHETLDPSRWGVRMKRTVIQRLASTVVFCGWTPMKRFGRRPPGQRWEVIPNAVPLPPEGDSAETREAVGRSLNLPPEAARLIMVGGARVEKGLDVLLDALRRRIRGGKRDFVLLVAGEPGAANEESRKTIDDLLNHDDLRRQVRMLGHRNDAPRLLAASDVFVLASRNEGMPLGVLEAFAAGLPAVLTDVGDCALLTGDGERGYTVPPENPQAFAEALDRLLSDPSARRAMGERARGLVNHRFQFSRFLRDVSQVLEETARRQVP